jgi:predicted  nucleic acid-binding Zn-ribbon protein
MRDVHPVFDRLAGAEQNSMDENTKLRALNALLRDRVDTLEAAIKSIRDKVHAHNRGGELHAGLRDVVRDACDAVMGSRIT